MTTGAERIALPGADLSWWPDLLSAQQARRSFEELSAGLPWQQRTIAMFGRDIPEPRLTSWHGDPQARYCYSGRDNDPLPWTPALQRLREALQQVGVPSNSVLANLYRDGADHMGWHADDEPELDPLIGSLSLGAVRRMQFRPRPRGPIALTLDLTPGSLLVMAGGTQINYHHRIPATRRPVGPRINLTFRTIRS